MDFSGHCTLHFVYRNAGTPSQMSSDFFSSLEFIRICHLNPSCLWQETKKWPCLKQQDEHPSIVCWNHYKQILLQDFKLYSARGFFLHPSLVTCTSTEWLYKSSVSRKDHNMDIYDVTQMISESLKILLKILQAREKECNPRSAEIILRIDQFWSSLLMTDVRVKVLCLTLSIIYCRLLLWF